MNDKDYKDMLQMLLQLTEKGKIKWEVGKKANQFKAKIGDGYVEVSHSDDPMLDYQYLTLALLNDLNQRVHVFSFNDSEEQDEFRQLAKLYNLVNDKVYKITETENSIMSALKDMSSSD